MIVEFGDWRLVPCEYANWELAHKHANKKGRNVGKVQWNRLGRFYQYNTFANAIEYAIDCDLREGKDVTTLADFLAQYRATVAEFKQSVAAMLGEAG